MTTDTAATTPCTLGQRAALEILWSRLDALRAHAPAAAAEAVEGVHEFRVASRRLVAALGVIKRFAPADTRAALRAQVRGITRLLGRPRELDVMLAQLQTFDLPEGTPIAAARDAAVPLLAARRAAESGACAAAGALPHAGDFLVAEAALLGAIRPGPTCWLNAAVSGLRRPRKRLLRAHRHWRTTEQDADLHAVRIAFKKFRYACEAHAPHYGAPMRDFLAELKRAQALLGDWNDCRVLAAELAGLQAQLTGAARPGLDTLIAYVDAQGEASKHAFESRCEDFFGKARQSRVSALFAAPETACCRELAITPSSGE